MFKDDFVLKHDSTFKQIESRKWRSSKIANYASNIALLLYNCSDGYRVKLLINEQEMPIPGCSSLFCPYSEFKALYQDFASCDWNLMCNPPNPQAIPANDNSPSLNVTAGKYYFFPSLFSIQFTQMFHINLVVSTVSVLSVLVLVAIVLLIVVLLRRRDPTYQKLVQTFE